MVRARVMVSDPPHVCITSIAVDCWCDVLWNQVHVFGQSVSSGLPKMKGYFTVSQTDTYTVISL